MISVKILIAFNSLLLILFAFKTLLLFNGLFCYFVLSKYIITIVCVNGTAHFTFFLFMRLNYMLFKILRKLIQNTYFGQT